MENLLRFEDLSFIRLDGVVPVQRTRHLLAWRNYDEKDIASALQWIALQFSFVLFLFYAVQVKRKTCGWEVIYISAIECVKYIIEIWWEHEAPATIYLSNGNAIAWLRYSEWLLTCPVILIALSRVGTTEGSYSKRTMTLLTSDQGTIMMGVTAAFAKGPIKAVFFCCGLCYGFNTFYTAAAVYYEAWKNVPVDLRYLVRAMAVMFYTSWCMFPILFLLGPEGFGHISHYGSIVGHGLADLLSKNLWGVLEWWLDYNICVRFSFEEEGEEEEQEEKLGEQKTVN